MSVPLSDWPALSSAYARFHRTSENQACHMVGVPLIVLAIVRFTQWPAGNPVPLAALALPIYFLWDTRLAWAMCAQLAVMSFAALHMSWGAAFGVFVLGWAFQFVGHSYYEKVKPAFAQNLVHLLVGPAWILQKLLKGRVTA